MKRTEADSLKAAFAHDGFVVLRNIVSRERLGDLHKSLTQAFDAASKNGDLFSGGGLVSGHLNCFPGAGARFAYETLQDHGIMDLMRELDPGIYRMPNVGCNFNLPGSHTQHYHLDRPFNRQFMIANVAVVDTTAYNGAMQAIPGSHRRFYRYAQFVLQRQDRRAIRVPLNQGDVLIRTSNVWHRGTTNRSVNARPMLAFTWEDGGGEQTDPFLANGGRIRFLPNWFQPTRLGRFRERLFVKVPLAYSALRFARSLIDSEY